jgi:hypothetical protein
LVGLTDMSYLRLLRQDRGAAEARQQHVFKTAGYRYARLLAQVDGKHWAGQEINPHDAGWDQLVAGATDKAAEFGGSIEWTIFGSCLSGDRYSRQSERIAVVRHFAQIMNGRSAGVAFVEKVNEPANGDVGPVSWRDLRELRDVFEQETGGKFLTALGAVNTERGEVPTDKNYEGVTAFSPAGWHRTQEGAEVGICHLDRDMGRGEGVDRPVRQGWDVGLENQRWADNEHVGPGSSVTSENRPDVLRVSRTVAFICRAFASCWHSNAGVRGLPFEGVAGYLQAPRAALWLPGDLPNGKQLNANSRYPERPFYLEDRDLRQENGNSRGVTRVYTCQAPDGTFYSSCFGMLTDVDLKVERPLAISVRNQDTGEILDEVQRGPGELLHIAKAGRYDWLIVSRPL